MTFSSLSSWSFQRNEMTEVAKTSSSSSEVTSSTDPPTFRVEMVIVNFINKILRFYWVRSYFKVETASKFLKNSKVVGSPLNVKKDFLMKKGLSEAEIEAALKLVETTIPEVPPTPPMPPINSVQSFYHVNSLSTKIRDFLNVLLLIGGFSYGAKYLWKVKSFLRWMSRSRNTWLIDWFIHLLKKIGVYL